ncbi:sugar ABC transporter substrate-binding protein [Oceanispirochaeta crateris]|nr:sugar ABC transporter substrate-binding protein [Oceanispirochaeta crateris]
MKYKIFILFCIIHCLTSCIKTKKDLPLIIVGYTLQDLKNPYFQALANGCRDRARELGIEIIIKDGASSAEIQAKQIREFIQMNVDAVICSPVESNSMIKLINECHDKGIPFINPNQKIEGADAQIALNEYDFGVAGGSIAGRFIRDVLQGKADVLVLSYLPETNLLQNREKGLIDGIHNYAPQAQIIARVPAHTPELGMVETEKALINNPTIKIIVAINDSGAIGAYEAVKTLGLDGPDFCVVGLDATSQAIEKMKHPDSIYRGTVDIDPYGSGKLIMDVTWNVLKNGPLNQTMQFPMTSVTKENLVLY